MSLDKADKIVHDADTDALFKQVAESRKKKKAQSRWYADNLHSLLGNE